MTVYKSREEKERDIILVNSTKMFSLNSNREAVMPSQLERVIFREDQAAATVRLAIDKALKFIKE